jgi:hypothetical protein
MKSFLTASAITVVALLLISMTPVAGLGRCPCVLICPAGDGGPVVSAGGGTKSPDLDGNGMVNLGDLARFATAWPPNPYGFCQDLNCDGVVNLGDLALFAAHWTHVGPIRGYNQPAIDHYKTYETAGPIINGPIWLRDQFGETVVTFLRLAKVATPVSKNGEAICDTIAHQTWWEFVNPEMPRMVVAQDQFGTQDWILGDARYLVLPALKNSPAGDELPVLNHYKCYDAQGPTQTITVRLRDQFGTTNVVVLEGRYFCNPCEKQIPDVGIYPIVDPLAHMTCYMVQGPLPYPIQVLVRDQFGMYPVVLEQNLFLCLPALKLEVIQPESSEWNRIKALYDRESPSPN